MVQVLQKFLLAQNCKTYRKSAIFNKMAIFGDFHITPNDISFSNLRITNLALVQNFLTSWGTKSTVLSSIWTCGCGSFLIPLILTSNSSLVVMSQKLSKLWKNICNRQPVGTWSLANVVISPLFYHMTVWLWWVRIDKEHIWTGAS